MLQLTQAPAPQHEVFKSTHPPRECYSRTDPTAEIRWRVGAALRTNPQFIQIENSCVSPSGSTLRCTGRARATRFCAKIYLVDLYPITRRFTVPGEEVAVRTEVCRPVEEQVASEWRRVQQIQSLVGSRNSPTPLGYSLEGRTLVFEEVTGVPAEQLTRPTWPGKFRVQSAESALFQSGAWLKCLHQASVRSCETVTPIAFLEQARRSAGTRLQEPSVDGRMALRPLEDLCRQIGPRTPLRVPTAMNHGDFLLGNLIWESKAAHLWVLDFGLSSIQSVLHDLGTIVLDLKMLLLDPRLSPRAVARFEQAFWSGYGSVAANLRALVNAVATHRLYSYIGQRMRSWRARGSWRGAINTHICKPLYERYLMSRIARGR